VNPRCGRFVSRSGPVMGKIWCRVRAHGTTLNSLFRFDQDLLVDAHVYGAPAAPVDILE
jgi:hypothetical protein